MRTRSIRWITAIAAFVLLILSMPDQGLLKAPAAAVKEERRRRVDLLRVFRTVTPIFPVFGAEGAVLPRIT